MARGGGERGVARKRRKEWREKMHRARIIFSNKNLSYSSGTPFPLACYTPNRIVNDWLMNNFGREREGDGDGEGEGEGEGLTGHIKVGYELRRLFN